MFHSVALLRTIAQEGSLSDSSEGLFQRDKQGARIYRSFCWKKPKQKTLQLNIKRLLLIAKNRHLKLTIVWGDVRVWADWNSPFGMHLHYLGPVSRFSSIQNPLRAPRWDGYSGWWLDGRQRCLFTETTGTIFLSTCDTDILRVRFIIS